MKTQSFLVNALNSRKQDLRRLEDQIRVLNPLSVLERGYSVTTTGDGTVVKDAGSLKKGARVITRVHKGSFASDVTGVDL
jgi:exodeoxyribonuclease VII large subunit